MLSKNTHTHTHTTRIAGRSYRRTAGFYASTVWPPKRLDLGEASPLFAGILLHPGNHQKPKGNSWLLKRTTVEKNGKGRIPAVDGRNPTPPKKAWNDNPAELLPRGHLSRRQAFALLHEESPDKNYVEPRRPKPTPCVDSNVCFFSVATT